MLVPDEEGIPGEWVDLDYYDGPLLSMALVTFREGEEAWSEPCLEVRHFGGWQGSDNDARPLPRTEAGPNTEDGLWHAVHARFTREQLQDMIDYLDGKKP